MAVTVTPSELLVIPNLNIQPTGRQSGSPGQFVDPQTGYEAWVMYGTGTGNGSGGRFAFNFTFPRGAYYYTWTAMYCARVDQGVSTELVQGSLIADWEAFTGENGALAGDLSEALEMENSTIRGITTNKVGQNGFRARYFGRPLTADSVMVVEMANTDTVVYDARIAGLRSLRPGIPWYDALQQARLL